MSVFRAQRSNPFFMNNKDNGFSLIEALVVITVLSIFAVFAIPMFGDLTQNNRMRAQISNLVGQFAQARTEAMRRGYRVTARPPQLMEVQIRDLLSFVIAADLANMPAHSIFWQPVGSRYSLPMRAVRALKPVRMPK